MSQSPVSFPDRRDPWPALPLNEWRDTYATLHMWTQIVGKVRLALSPPVNHWWHVPLYVSSRGLTTSAMPYGSRSVDIAFDFIDHKLDINCSDGQSHAIRLYPRSVSDFYAELMASLKELGMEVKIWTTPVEVADPIPFERDDTHASYDLIHTRRFLQVLLQVDRVFEAFRGRFLGKCSPVHFFWGSFDLAVTRFSGRPAPAREGADPIMLEAYSHEVISHGFWPGGNWFGNVVASPIFYAYVIPEPPGLREQPVQPPEARFDAQLGEFVLNYDDLRTMDSPEDALMAFLQSSYEAGANLAGWDRKALERPGVPPAVNSGE